MIPEFDGDTIEELVHQNGGCVPPS